MILQRTGNAVLIVGLVLSSTVLYGRDKHPKPDRPQDRIQVVAHIPATGEEIVRFLSTQHYRRNYLYAEHQSGKTVTLIDVTNTSHPAVIAEMSYPGPLSHDLVAVAGNAALVSTATAPAVTARAPQTFRILSFADPASSRRPAGVRQCYRHRARRQPRLDFPGQCRRCLDSSAAARNGSASRKRMGAHDARRALADRNPDYADSRPREKSHHSSERRH